MINDWINAAIKFFSTGIDYDAILISMNRIFSQPVWVVFWLFFKSGGWAVFLIIFLWGGWLLWVDYVQDKGMAGTRWIMLAIDIPRNNEKGPESAEQLFAHVSGAHSEKNFFDKYIKGDLQQWFSFEIVSIDGYIQFMVRTPAHFKDLIEASFYAQYPDAEITEVADYVDSIPDEFPSEEYDMWAAEIVTYNNQAYPIRTYPQFEHKISMTIKDPMAALLEILGKLQKGEQVWIQFVITPTGTGWKKEAAGVVKKLMGEESGYKETTLDKILFAPMKAIEAFGQMVYFVPYEPKKEEKKAKKDLSPGDKKVIEGIQNKISKMGFETKIRMMYVAKKEVFSKGKRIAAIFGAFKQFSTLDMNGFKPSGKISTSVVKYRYFFPELRANMRKRHLIRICKTRSNSMGSKRYILNIEELASLFHFPVLEVKAPMLRKTESKKAEPPYGLPTEQLEEETNRDIIEDRPPAKRDEPPADLPVIDDMG